MSEVLVDAAQALPTIFHGTAIISTTVRLFLRYRTRRCWWDDAWAAFSLAYSILLLVAIWAESCIIVSRHTRIIFYWLDLVSFNGNLWAARMSLIFAIIRITPPTLGMRRIASGAAVFIGLMWITFLVQALWYCGHDTSWYHHRIPSCRPGRAVAPVQLSMNLITDAMLAAIPLRLLSNAKLHKNQHRLLRLLFSASILTTLVGIARVVVVFQKKPHDLSAKIVTNVQVAMSLIVCNAPVLGSCFYRIFFRNEQDFETTVDYSGIVHEAIGRADNQLSA